MSGDIRSNLSEVLDRIEECAKMAGRPAGEVSLVAVSKTFDGDHIRPALEAGHRLFGENRVQEAAGKWPELRAQFNDVELHLIGPLQTNKVKQALDCFDVIETLDRPKLARAVASELEKRQQSIECLVQVNTGEEDQKAGISPDEADGFISYCREELGLNVTGLMCIPPVDAEPALHFALLRKIAQRNGLEKLSMGMSGDYDVAAQFGATHVRVGSAIFGERSKPV